MYWPDKDTEIEFDGHNLLLRPETKELMPSVAFEFGSKGITYEDAMHLIQRFLSSLSWVENVGIRAEVWTGGGFPTKIGKSANVRHVAPKFDKTYLPNPTDKKQILALAIYRDALGVNSVPYKFLGLARIINIIGKSHVQKKWINDNLSKLTDPESLNIISALRTKGVTDIGYYLYNSGRSSVAHAEDEVVNPDIVTDVVRLSRELPLMQDLAELFIENELGIKSQRTIYREHLYELDGFKKIISQTLIDEAKKGVNRKVEKNEIDLQLKVGLRTMPDYSALNTLVVDDAQLHNGSIQMILMSPDKLIQVWLGLNFQGERLMFWPDQGVRFFDDGSKTAAIKMKSLFEFKRDLFGNGALEVNDVKSGKLLGHADPFIPTNIDLSVTTKNFNHMIAECELMVQERT